MITIREIESIKHELIDIFPDAVRGSVSKSKWGSGKRDLHLAYFIGPDSVGGYKVTAKNGLFQFVSWDTNQGIEWMYCHSDSFYFIDFIREMFAGEKHFIDRLVRM